MERENRVDEMKNKKENNSKQKKTGSMDRKKWCVCGFFSQAVNAITQNSHRRLFARPLIMIIIIILPRQNQKTIFSVNVTEGGWVCVCFSMYLFLFILFFFSLVGVEWSIFGTYTHSTVATEEKKHIRCKRTKFAFFSVGQQ